MTAGNFDVQGLFRAQGKIALASSNVAYLPRPHPIRALDSSLKNLKRITGVSYKQYRQGQGIPPPDADLPKSPEQP